MALRSDVSDTVDYDHILDKVIARSVMLGYMKSYGVLDLIGLGSSRQTSYNVIRIPQDCVALGRERGKVDHVGVARLEELVAQGYRVVKRAHVPQALVDVNDRVFLVIVPAPEELLQAGLSSAFLKSFTNMQEDFDFGAINAVKTTISDCVPRSDRDSLSSGIFLGVQSEPQAIIHTRHNEEALSRLCEFPAIRSVSQWQSKCCEEWMPQSFALSKDALAKAAVYKPALSKGVAHPFGFASVTFDFGSSQNCDIYLDPCPFHPGICALTAGRDYDPTAGGHLVLKELKILVEIPPCTTVLFAPAMINYNHVAVGNRKNRVSMMHSTAGNLLAWAVKTVSLRLAGVTILTLRGF